MSNCLCLILIAAAIYLLAAFGRLDLLLVLLPISLLFALAVTCSRRRQANSHARGRKEVA